MSEQHQNSPASIHKTALENRTELPSELQFLLQQYPRAVWKGHPNMSNLLRFWVSKHNEFNKVCADLSTNNQAFLEGKITPDMFQKNMVPKISWLLAEFAEHHHIEDHFTFPALRKAEPKLNNGFDILDADHEALNASLQAVTQASNALIQCQNNQQLPTLGEHFVRENDALTRRLIRHLIDEEEVVIPLFLDRGEQVLLGG